ncbi:MAG: zinc-dependent alcohol dehydrogenase [Gaiellaceae bacterium]
MKALRLHAPNELRLHDEPDPSPLPGEVLVRVAAVGLCGSDRHWLLDGGIGDAVLSRPLVLGHEFAGVLASGPDAGQRVAVDPALPCGVCETCTAGLEHLCPGLRFAGHGDMDGALRTILTWPETLVHPVPERLSDVEAALAEPLGVALHAFDLGHVRPGDGAGVFGCGPLGLILVQLLHMAGVAPIVATDALAHRVAAAERVGATHAALAGDRSAHGLDVAFEAAGDDGAVADAIASLRPGGRLVLVGIPDDDRTAFVASAARRKGLTLLLSRRMTSADLPRALRLVADGRVDLESLVSDRFAFEEWPAAFEALRERRGLKVMIGL